VRYKYKEYNEKEEQIGILLTYLLALFEEDDDSLPAKLLEDFFLLLGGSSSSMPSAFGMNPMSARFS